MDRLKYGVVGIKGVGRGHLKAISQTGQAQLAAVCEIDEEALKKAGEEYKVRGFTDYQEMLKSADIDAVSICTPHYLHCPMALEAFEAGKHVFVEKPIAITAKEADTMIERAKEKGLKLGVQHQHHTMGINRMIKELIDKGRLGNIIRFAWTMISIRTQAYYNSGEWRGTWAKEGGGVLINQGIHYLELLCWLLGAPEEVSAQIGNWAHDTEVEDIASISLRLKNGAFGIVQLGLVSLPNNELNIRQISGDKATLVIDQDQVKLGTPSVPVLDFIKGKVKTEGKPETDWETLQPPETEQGVSVTIRDFTSAVLNDHEPMISGEQARIGIEFVNAIILSSFEGKSVKIPIDRDEYDNLMEELKLGKRKISRYGQSH